MKEIKDASPKPLNNLLRMAVIAGVESAVCLHIERGDDLNARDASGLTPLMISAARNKPAICKLLLNAGANAHLIDHTGRTALQIAIDSQASAVADILKVVTKSISSKNTHSTESSSSNVSSEQNSIYSTTSDASPIVEDEFIFSEWEAENEPIRPNANAAVEESARAIQVAITNHRPIDSSTEWDDVDTYLPDAALPLAHIEDIEGRVRLRLLLLRALREGSVPALDVQTESNSAERLDNPEAEAFLTMIINDLGAETDERIEYISSDENFKVFLDPEETYEEEKALDEAILSIDNATSPRYQPLRMYLREFQSMELLSAEEEVRLAQEMEAALDVALDALATWPEGIMRILAAGADAIAGTRKISAICLDDNPKPESTFTGILEGETGESTSLTINNDADDKSIENFSSQNSGDTLHAKFSELLKKLSILVDNQNITSYSRQKIRKILSTLRLNRNFFLELIDAANGSRGCSEYLIAMRRYQRARDRMTTANLKLSFFNARKYIGSGEPLDDLVQEGNLGLLKAVDRYDWRRGFRFSTYATWWIRQGISRYIADKSRTIRIPIHIQEKMRRLEKITLDFESIHGHKPKVEELAKQLEISNQACAALQKIQTENIYIDEHAIDRLMSIDTHHLYIAPDPETLIEHSQITIALGDLISSLSTTDRREELILRMRFGLGVPEPLNLDQIGRRMKVTRERIRQIENQAIKKLKQPSLSNPFAQTVLGLKTTEKLQIKKKQEPALAKKKLISQG